MLVLPKKEMCFWPAKTGKKLDFFEMHNLWDLELKSCSDINERNWIELPFIFAVLVKIVPSLVGRSRFYLWVTFQVEVFSYSFLRIAYRNLHELLNCFYCMTTSKFFVSKFEGHFGLFFKYACNF